jgi:uncharacterized protein with ParB-like and HNH nuclease domain
MQIDAQVKSISDINQFFIVPDYQREYVWKANDQVKQFITDIDNAFETSNNDFRRRSNINYFNKKICRYFCRYKK